MKLYTGAGDDGSTGLFGGQRVSKTDLRVEAYGSVDELNSSLGLAAVSAGSGLRERLYGVQEHLFQLGAELASPSPSQTDPIDPVATAELERLMDSLDEQLPPLQRFILPGGSDTAARLHVARTVCRRAERRVAALHAEREVGQQPLVYLNRLGDLLFALARWANQQAGVADVEWRGRPQDGGRSASQEGG
jgi:cob(I)alamin adenosyltransferase